MERQPADKPIRQAVTVPVPAGQAFSAFADLARWWPREYTWAADTLEDIGIEPRQGGHCYERGPHGFTCHWGRVLVWDPPTRLVLAWQIAPDRVPEPNRLRPARSRSASTQPAPPAPGSSSSTAPSPATGKPAADTVRPCPLPRAGPCSSTATPPPSADKLATARERGGTGRRAGFRTRWGNPWGFESPRSHPPGQAVQRYSATGARPKASRSRSA